MKQISVSREELRKRKLFVAVPMYGGTCTGVFARSFADLTARCLAEGIELKSYFLFNESLIPRARNYCVDHFLASDSTHFMFIDADIGFDPVLVLQLLALVSDDSEYDVIGAAYPERISASCATCSTASASASISRPRRAARSAVAPARATPSLSH